MSVVCAKIYDNYITIASDSGVYASDTRIPSTTIEKLLHIDEDFIIGVCGDVGEMNLMRWFAQEHRPVENTEQGIFHFMGEFAEFCREELAPFGEDEGPEGANEYLIVYQGKLYGCVGTQVHGINEYAAIGAGAPYALSALVLGKSPCEAVRVASELCVFVHTPVHECYIDKPKEE